MPEQTRSTRSPSCCRCPYRWVMLGQAAAHRTGQHLTPSCLLHQCESEPWCNAETDFQQFTASPFRKDFHPPKILRMTTEQLLSIFVFAWLKCFLREVTFPKTSLLLFLAPFSLLSMLELNYTSNFQPFKIIQNHYEKLKFQREHFQQENSKILIAKTSKQNNFSFSKRIPFPLLYVSIVVRNIYLVGGAFFIDARQIHRKVLAFKRQIGI